MVKAGDEIRALARFSSTQRTAFRKLLKKFKKWTGSTNLEDRFREEVLDDPKSFTKFDLGPLLDDYSVTLQRIRSLYETRLEQSRSPKLSADSPALGGASEVKQLQSVLDTGSAVSFDAAIATVPLGETGEIANYFVHPDSVVELQILLLQRMQYYASRSRSNSAASPISTANNNETAITSTQNPDYFMLIADNLERFANEQSALTVDQREHLPGVPPQKAKTFVRWNNSEDAVVSARVGRAKVESARLKRKRIDSIFEKDPSPVKAPKPGFENDDQTLSSIREAVGKDRNIRPLFQISTCRSRFTGIGNGNDFSLATLDTAISIQKTGNDADAGATTRFPFAVLQVRAEAVVTDGMIASLDRSHLVERVRGFSLEYHALWQLYRPDGISPPFWMPILSEDIRKLPPPALERADSGTGSGSGAQPGTRRSISTPSSALGITDTTTAVDTDRPSSTVLPDLPEIPPLKSFRKKRRRTYADRTAEQQQKYWSEYDHPEDGEDSGDAYVLYIDPNEKSALDRLLDKLGGLWGRSSPEEEEALLPSPTEPNDDETSDEEQAMFPRHSYGTVAQSSPSSGQGRHSASQRQHQFLPPITITCLVASVAILVVAYILKTTSKHKYETKADVGIIFAIACSVGFAVTGFAPLLSRRNSSWAALIVAAVVLILDVVFSGYLLALMLG